MTTLYITIGSMENMHAYDDNDYDVSIETDGPIKHAGGTEGEHSATVNQVETLGGAAAYFFSVVYS